MAIVNYKGYVVRSRPFQLAADNRWTMDLFIERHDGDGVTTRSFSTSNTFEIKESADLNNLRLGCQIIDGRVPGCEAP